MLDAAVFSFDVDARPLISLNAYEGPGVLQNPLRVARHPSIRKLARKLPSDRPTVSHHFEKLPLGIDDLRRTCTSLRMLHSLGNQQHLGVDSSGQQRLAPGHGQH